MCVLIINIASDSSLKTQTKVKTGAYVRRRTPKFKSIACKI